MKGTGPDARYYIDSEHLAAVRLLADSADETLGHQRVALVSLPGDSVMGGSMM